VGTVSGWNRKHTERRTQRRYIYYTCYRRRVHAGCDQPFFSEDQVEAEVLAVLSAMATPDGLAEAVEFAISKSASQQRKLSRGGRRKMIDQQLKRIAELYEIGEYTRQTYEDKRADLLIERDTLEVVPATASLAVRPSKTLRVRDGGLDLLRRAASRA
jgi:recombinase-like zinc beta ribbon protein